MTIAIQLLNQSNEHEVEIIYSDSKFGTDGHLTGERVESQAGIIKPRDFSIFYIHSNRNLIVVEK